MDTHSPTLAKEAVQDLVVEGCRVRLRFCADKPPYTVMESLQKLLLASAFENKPPSLQS